MTKAKTQRTEPPEQPEDEDIDFSDIPEVNDFSKAVRGKFYEQATGRPLPPPVKLLNKAEAEVRRLREENRQLDEIARAAAAWCAERPDEGTPLLRDLLHAHGYDPRPREPDPEVWLPDNPSH